MTTIYVFGDSFTVPNQIYISSSEQGLYASPGESWSQGAPKPKFPTWINLVAAALSQQHQELDLINHSQHGVSQDFCWLRLIKTLPVIRPEDYVIVAVTHPNRFWYLEEHPNLSNHHIINLENMLTEQQALAVKLFMQHIQRPQLDTLHQTNRMRSLAYEVIKRGLRRPLMINCFASDITEVEQLDDLMWAKGNLFSIQALEYLDGEEESTTFFNGVDCRYNHLCLSNHRILADKIFSAFGQGTVVDLDQGFHQGLLKDGVLEDTEFCLRELDWDKLQFTRQQEKTKKYPWLKLR
jgi:hypothetical protein